MRVIFAILLIISIFAAPVLAAGMDDDFLNMLERDSILYFAYEVNPANGLIKDSSRPGAPCSTAVVGFALTAMCIGEYRGWIDHEQAYGRVLNTLKFFRDRVPQEHGFFYHFLDMRTGARAWSSELSSIDTALFLAGALFAGEFYKGTEVESIAKELYERVDWPWMMNGKDIICMGWTPESGFLWYYWDYYSEAMVLYALAIGSPTHPISKDSWKAWKRPEGQYKDHKLIYCPSGSIFTYQYSHGFIDFRDLFDGSINYFENSISATKANKQFCIDNSNIYKTYGENSWGLTACIGPDGYRGYGAKPGDAFNDGTISPCGMAGSMPFDKESVLGGLKDMYDKHKNFLYGKYGFKDAFNIDKNWWAEEYLGIDVGITAVMIENSRSGLIWKHFMALKPIRDWAESCMIKSADKTLQ